MKKALAFLLMFAIIAVIPAAAAPGEVEYARILRVDDGQIDMSHGNKDEAFNTATPITVDRNRDGDPDGATALVYMVWSEAALYVFAEITDNHVYDQMGIVANAWETDSFEVFVDMGDSEPESIAPLGNLGLRAMQYRIDRFGYPSSFPSDGDWGSQFLVGYGDNVAHGAGDNADIFEWAISGGGTASSNYSVKFRLFRHAPISPGEVGIHFQINDRNEFGEQTVIWPDYGNTADSWEVEAYGFVTLVDEPAIAPAAAEPEPEAPAADEPAEEAPAVADAAPAAEAEAAQPAPPTADPVTLAALGSLIAVAGAVIAKKRK